MYFTQCISLQTHHISSAQQPKVASGTMVDSAVHTHVPESPTLLCADCPQWVTCCDAFFTDLFPFPVSVPASLLAFPSVTSQTHHLPSKPCSRVCFLETKAPNGGSFHAPTISVKTGRKSGFSSPLGAWAPDLLQSPGRACGRTRCRR